MGSRTRGMRGMGMIAVAAGAIAFGCNLLTGASDLSISTGATGEGGSGESDASRDGGGMLAATCVAAGGYAGVCLHDKEGWTPVVLPVAGGVCPPDYRTRDVVSAADTTRDTCSCSCAPKIGSCEGPLSLFTGTSAPTCTQGPTTVTFPPDGGCLVVPVNTDAARVRMALAGTPPKDCAATANESFGPILSLPTCTGATATRATECDGVGCYPAPPPGTKACVFHEGETSCPRGYDVRVVAGRDAKDDRSCESSCTCVEEGCKDAKVQQYLDEKCTLPVGNLPLDECRPQTAGLVRGASYKPPAACRAVKPVGAAVTGKVTFEGARTICCTP